MNKALQALTIGLVILAAGCNKQGGESGASPTFSSFDLPSSRGKILPARAINLEQADIKSVSDLYAEISGRSVIRAGNLPKVQISFFNQAPMSTVRALQALDTALAAQGVAAVVQGTQYIKLVPEQEACRETEPVIGLTPDQLPDSSSFLVYIVKPKKGQGIRVVSMLQPFSKMQNSIVYIGGSNNTGPSTPPSQANISQQIWNKIGSKDDVLILRDYSSNVKTMMKVLDTIEE